MLNGANIFREILNDVKNVSSSNNEMKAIYVTYESISGDSHTDPIAVFTPDHYDDLEKILAELKKEETYDTHFDAWEYEPLPLNPTDAKQFLPEKPLTKEDNRQKFIDLADEIISGRIPKEYGTSTSLEPPEQE